MHATRSWGLDTALWLHVVPDEGDAVITVRFRLNSIVGQGATINLIIPEKELAKSSVRPRDRLVS